MYNIDLNDLLCTHSVFCENNLLSKKKTKPKSNKKNPTKHENSSSSWQINLLRAKHCTFVIPSLFLKSLCVTSLLPSVRISVLQFILKNASFFQSAFLLLLLFFIRVGFPWLFSSVALLVLMKMQQDAMVIWTTVFLYCFVCLLSFWCGICLYRFCCFCWKLFEVI